jgi:signal transduction histidine kinase/CheY-like chemotaxis protein
MIRPPEPTNNTAKISMAPEIETLFDRATWSSALEKYAAVVHLAVQLYDSSGALVNGPAGPTPLFELVAHDGSPPEFAECAASCLAQPENTAKIVINKTDDIAVIGAPLRLDHRMVGAAVAGFALSKFPDSLSIERFSRRHGLSTEELWAICRALSPVHERQLTMRAELLQVIGESLLREQAKSRESARLYKESRQANRTKDEFLSVLSHELRTALNAIVASIAVGQMKRDDPAVVGRVLDRIAKAQVQVIDDLLDVSRIVTGKLRMELAPIELNKLVADSLDTIRPAAEAKAIELVPVIDSSAGVIVADRTRLQQVLWNLLSNAVKFTAIGGRVQVMVRRAGEEQGAITVNDNGEGIDPAFLPHVFERFSQSESSTSRRHFGLGLGLAISRHLVEMHGGTIRAESQGQGKGASFTIELPLKHRPGMTASRAPEPLQSTGISPPSPDNGSAAAINEQAVRGLTVMLVEDDLDGREALASLLEHFGVNVVTAASAAETLATLPRVKPDVLLADIGLPDEDGYSLLKKVRALPVEQGGRVPALALTGFTRDQDRRLALAAGFQGHVGKPFKIDS